MTRHPFAAAAAFAAICHLSFGQPSDDAQHHWPAWRGPMHNGFAPHGDPPTEWSEDSGVVWKSKIPGRGSATPIVWGDRVFVATAVPTDRTVAVAEDGTTPSPPQPQRNGRRRAEPPQNFVQYQLHCLALGTGNTLWQDVAIEAVPIEAGHSTNTHASASPVTNGQHVYVSFGSQGIFCYTMGGERVWSRDLGDMQTCAGFGEGASPALHGNTLVVNWDHEGQSFVTALDATNGEPRWQKERDERTTWVTPLVVEAAGKTQVIVNASNRTRSYGLENGEVIWECGGQVGNPIPTPVVFENNVICMSGYRGAAIYSIPLDSKGDVTDSDTLTWHANRAAPYVPSPLVDGDHLYFTKSNNGILSMVDARTGKFLIDQKRLGDISSIYASPAGAAGRVYIVGRDGTTMVLREGDEYEVLAVNRLSESVDASPVIVGDKLLLRGEKHLYCLGR